MGFFVNRGREKGRSSNTTYGDQVAKAGWGYLQDAATGGRGATGGWDKLKYFPDQTYVDQDPASLASFEARESRATEGSAVGNAAQRQTQDVIEGRYLEGNPYADSMFDRMAGGIESSFLRSALPAIESRFARSGGDSGAYMRAREGAQGDLMSGLEDAANSVYYRQYDAERNRQDAASRFAPALADMEYQDIDELRRVGVEREGFAQTELDELMDRFYFAQNEPFMRVNRVLGELPNLPLAAGGGQTRYTGSTENWGRQPSNKQDGPAMWERILTAAL